LPTHTHRHVDSTDNKGRLKLAAARAKSAFEFCV